MLDSSPALVTELEAAKAKLAPEIRGLSDINNDPLPDAVHVIINDAISARERRTALIQAVLDELALLTADGYPAEVPNIELSSDQLALVNSDVSDVDTAATLFTSSQPAHLSIDLGQPAPKPPPT